MTEIFDLSESWVREYADLDPYAATMWGMRELEDRMPDYSPGGLGRGSSIGAAAWTGWPRRDRSRSTTAWPPP